MIDMESQLNLAFLLGKQHFNLKYVCKDTDKSIIIINYQLK